MSNNSTNNDIEDDVWILQKNRQANISDYTHGLIESNNREKLYDSVYYNSKSQSIPSTNKDDLVVNVTSKISKPKSRITMFCEAISIRGMQKIVKAPNQFVKIVWITFVILMTILLVVTSYFLINDFFNYNTAWHTSTAFDQKTPFPAISLCSHNPFAKRAKSLWDNNIILSPQGFRKMLVDAAIKMMPHSNGTEILYDSAENYYGNIDYESTVNLSHTKSIFKYCMVFTKMYNYVAENCDLTKSVGMRIRSFSSGKYFNCFTLEENPNADNDGTKSNSAYDLLLLIILVELTPESDLPQLNEGFPMDSLIRGNGLKLVLHEAGTYPEIESDGINLQPGKMNEINFETVHWKRYNSPKRPCLNGQAEIKDVGQIYKYTLNKCLEAELQKRAINQCKCMSALWPRPKKPSNLLPYCINISATYNQMIERYLCPVFSGIEKTKEKLVDKECFGVCSYYTYESKVSVTNWKPSMKKLSYVAALYRWLSDNDLNKESIEKLTESIKNDNLNMTILNDETRFSYINVVRKNYDTTTKTEKLVIDVSIFMSRVGGLCSLFIGLTTAVFAELVEFFYMAFYKR